MAFDNERRNKDTSPIEIEHRGQAAGTPGKSSRTAQLAPASGGAAPVQRKPADPQASAPAEGAMTEDWTRVAFQPARYSTPELKPTAQLRAAGRSEPPVQRAADDAAAAKPANTTGMPDQLKTGIEGLSGLAMDDVKVHYNSSRPSELDALAYTQGSDIYVGPGQERHLAHEAWHVVQQKQSRVGATTQSKGVDINDASDLEREADEMGARASAQASVSADRVQLQSSPASGGAAQLLKDPIDGSTKASIIGADAVPVRKAADATSDSVGELAKGAECDIVEVSGNFTKVSGKDKTSGEAITGFVPSAYVSTRARQLSQIAQDLDADMDDLYAKSFNDDKTVVEEWGATIVEKDGTYSAKNKRTGHDGGSLPGGYDMDVDKDEQVIGGVHSHPYSVDEGSVEGVGFSAGDISYMRNYVKTGFQHWAEAGTARFTLVISDEDKAKQFFKDNSNAEIQTTWNTEFGASKGTFQERVIKAVQGVIGANGANGIEFYATFDDDKQKFDKL